MAFHLIHFSKNLQGYTDVDIYLPVGTEYEDMLEPGERFQTLWLLHGYSGNFSEWCRNTSVEKLAMLNGFAVVSVDGGNSFYNDMPNGEKYYTYISEELPVFLRKHFPLSDRREDNFIAGLSMGGFGACKLGFANPDNYCAVGSFSCGPADMITEFSRKDYKHAKQFARIFGPDDLKPGTPNDIRGNLLKLKQSGRMPLYYDACGTDDGVYSEMMEFRRFAEENGLGNDIIFDGIKGVHSWEVWDECIRRFVEMLPLRHKGIWRQWYNERHPEAR